MAQLLNQIIKTLFIHVLGVLLIITLFHMYYSNQNKKHKIVTEQIEGLSYIYKFNELRNNIQKIRELSQITLTTKEQKELEKKILDEKEKILHTISNIKRLNKKDYSKFNTQLQKTIHSIEKVIQTKDGKAKEIFQIYTSLINDIDNLYIVITDKYRLQLESDRLNYFLMELTINDIAQIQEDFAKVRGYGSYMVSTNNITQKDSSMLIYHMQNIKKIELDIQTYLELLEDKKNSFDEFNLMLNRLKINIEKVNDKIDSVFIKKQLDETAINYYSFVSQCIIDTNEFFLKTHQFLNESLQNKKQSLKTQLFYSWILVSIILLGIIIGLTINIMNIFKNEDTKYKQFVLKDFKNKLQEATTLKDVCNVSLNKVCRYYKALSGVIYLYNKQNKKLYLGATFGLHEDSIATVISLGEGDIGQVAKDFEPILRASTPPEASKLLPSIKYTHIEPIMHENDLIAVVEYTTNYKIQQNIILNALNEIMSSYIYDSTLLNHTAEMIELIDENIITSQTNINGIITNVSSAFAKISGYTKEEMIGKNHNILRHPDMPDEIYKELWESITNGESWMGEMKNLKKDATYYWVKIHIYPNYDLYKNIVGYTAIRQEITDKKHIEELSIRDSMTSLYNRRYFESIFDKVILETKNKDTLLAFAMIDVDHFKLFNDTYGHQKGDSTLKAIANILKENTSSLGEYVFRLGGEEFGILFETKSKQSALETLENIKEDIESLHMEHEKNSASKYVTISIGLFVNESKNNLEINKIYKYADEALYKAKESGRNTIVLTNI